MGMKQFEKIQEAERIKLLFKKNTITLALGLFCSAMYFIVFKSDNSNLVLLLIVTPYPFFSLFRYLLCGKFIEEEKKDRIRNYPKWENKYIFLTLLAGLSFGLMNYWCFSQGKFLTQLFCIAMVMGFTSGAVNAYGSSIKTVMAFMVPSLTFLIACFLFKGGEKVHYILAFMSFLFLLNGYSSAKNVYDLVEKQVENQLNNIHTSKMGALGEMATGMAHEINNPLTIISGHLQYAMMNLNTSPPKVEKLFHCLNTASSHVERIVKIISALRNYAKDIPNEEQERILVNDLVKTAENFVHSKIREKKFEFSVNFHDEISPESQMVICRRLEINQVFINLINNSIEAIENFSERWIRVDIHKKKDFIVFQISDSGNGISSDIEENMFFPFYTSKTKENATGLGLSTALGIVEAHGGELKYLAEMPHTTFEFTLPSGS